MLRMNECTDCVETKDFDVWQLKEEYEKFLSNKGLYDSARLLREAADYLEGQDNNSCIAYNYDYAILDDHTPTMLEKRLLNKLCGNKINVISAKTKEKTKPSFFKAYGMADEILTIANKIKNEKLYAGDTAIYYTNKAYINMIKAVFDYNSISVFFAEGKDACETNRFILWNSIIDWWDNNCRMIYFENILMNKSMKIISDDGTIVSKEKILGFFRTNAGYLFGRDNHIRIAQADDSGEDKYKKYAITIVRDLVGIFCDPDNNGYIIPQSYKLSELFDKMSAFIRKYCPDEKELLSAEKKITDELKYNDSDFSDKEACALLKKLIGSVRIRDRYDADAAVAMPLTNRKSISPKAHTFVVGMSTSLVLKKADESPLITDKQIGELFDGEIAALYQGGSNNDLMLASAEYLCDTISDNGSLCISYPYYDQANLRNRSSSYIFEKLAEGVSQIEDHNSLGFLSSYDSFEDESKKQNVFVLKGADEENPANNSGQTENPENTSLRLSASAFNTLLVCPKKYEIKYVDHIKDEPEEKKDSYSWLEANQKGTFFHSVMEQYIDEYCGKNGGNLIDRAGTDKDFIFDETRFEDVFNKVEKENELIPYELLSEKNHELDEIRETAKAYLEGLSKDNGGYTPCAVEYRFDNDYEDRDLGLTYNIGFLDRIDVRKDVDGKLNFRIVDYKTGKIDTFMKNHKIILVQHYVYMKFLENEVKDAAVVDGFEFVFPFEKEKVAYEYKEDGTFEKLVEKPDCAKIIYNGKAVINETVKELLKIIKDKLKEGKYPDHSYSNEKLDKNKPKNPTYDEIQYCPFKDICGNCK